MAQINIIKPKYGSIEVIDINLSHYTVRYDPPGGDVEVDGWKVFCQECGGYFYTSVKGNPVSFDIQALLDAGHPGPFDISVDVSAEVEYQVTTRPDGPSMGTTSPIEQWFTAAVGTTIEFTITATPKEGYEFVKWVSSTGAEFTDARTTIRKRIEYGTDSCEYVAYFKKKTYLVYVLRKRGTNVAGSLDRRLSYDGGVSSTDGPRTVYYNAPNIGNVAVAVIYSNKISAYADSDVTLRVEMLPAAEEYGVRFLHWFEVSSRKGGGELSYVVHVGASNINVYAYFTVDAVKVTFTVKSPLYGLIGRYDTTTLGAKRGVYPNGESLPDSIDRFSCFITAVPKNTKFEISLYLWRRGLRPPEDKMTIAAENAFYHGSSSSKFIYDDDIGGSFTSGEEDEEVEIYLCTHLLVHKPDGQNLESKPPALLYDCNMPENE